MTGDLLDRSTWAALTGPHAHLGERRGAAARYRPDVTPFAALAGGPGTADPAAWADLAALVGPGRQVVLAGDPPAAPDGWTVAEIVPGVQMVGPAAEAGADPEVVRLGAADVPEMLDLVARTRPGPFRPSTHLMGVYLGIRSAGRLVAMAGERVRPPGWSEISAVCTDPEHRGRGLAGRLVRAVTAAVRDAGGTPFLHAAASNTAAIRLYRTLGFELRREVTFAALRTPGG